MLSCRLLLCSTVTSGMCAVTLAMAAPTAAATPVGLAFDLPQSAPPPKTTPTASPAAETASAYAPLPIPPAAARPPTRGIVANRQNSRVYQTKAAPDERPSAQLPPPPPGAVPQSRVLVAQEPAAAAPQASPTQTPEDDIALGFPQMSVSQPTAPVASSEPTPEDTRWIFEGGPDSLVARIVGSAEGTRAPTGERTRHYNGHRDPGNGVWNLGTFSYQHGAASPEEADAKQLARLARQEGTIDRKAERLGLQLTLVQRLNALDLANQSPAAALNDGGYVDRLYQAQQAGRIGDEAILWARTYAYMNPKTQRWNAPGLGNTYQSIRRDQNRRLQAIASALEAFQIQQALAERPEPAHQPLPAMAQPPTRENDAEPAIATAAPSFTAPGGAAADPLDFDLSETEQTATANTTSPEIQLSILQSSVSDTVTPAQAGRILNRARLTGDTTPTSAEPARVD